MNYIDEETLKRYRKAYEEYNNIKLPKNAIVVLTKENGTYRHLRYLETFEEVFMWNCGNPDNKVRINTF